MTLGARKKLFTRVLNEFLITVLALPGYDVVFGQVHRTPEQQEIYLKTGKSKTKNSTHLLSMAADLNVFVDGEYIDCVADDNKTTLTDEHKIFFLLGEEWEKICTKYGVTPEWGGRFGVASEDFETKLGWDANHFGIKNE
jgi:hypothetical protein